MINPKIVVRPTSRYGVDEPKWRTCWIWCPGCDHAKGIPVAGEDGTLPATGPYWVWNGDLVWPTLSPSILQDRQGLRCHSFLRDGYWEFLSDCTHALAGQTVPMVPLPDWVVNQGRPQ